MGEAGRQSADLADWEIYSDSPDCADNYGSCKGAPREGQRSTEGICLPGVWIRETCSV